MICSHAGGLARGTVVSVDGAASVLIGLLATVTAAGGHVAVIGMPGLGLLAFHEQGGDLAKVALVPQPKDAAIDCAAILLEGFDVVVLGLSGGAVTPSRGRAVAARARSKGSLLIVTEGQWDGPDLRISSRVAGYTGLTAGRGAVRAWQGSSHSMTGAFAGEGKTDDARDAVVIAQTTRLRSDLAQVAVPRRCRDRARAVDRPPKRACSRANARHQSTACPADPHFSWSGAVFRLFDADRSGVRDQVCHAVVDQRGHRPKKSTITCVLTGSADPRSLK